MISPTARLRPLAGALLALALIVFGAPWSTSQVVSAQAQQLFLSVTDASGEPVTDLTAEELSVRWDGEDCETLNVEPINWPVRITVFVDNGVGGREALQNMREGLKLFVVALPEEVEVGLATIAGRPRFVTQHTSDRAEIARGIDLMVPDSGAARFRDALIEEAERLDEDEERQYFPVIVMVASDGPEGSTSQQQAYDEMVERMVAASATVHTRMFSGWGPGQQVAVPMNLREATGGSYGFGLWALEKASRGPRSRKAGHGPFFVRKRAPIAQSRCVAPATARSALRSVPREQIRVIRKHPGGAQVVEQVPHVRAGIRVPRR